MLSTLTYDNWTWQRLRDGFERNFTTKQTISTFPLWTFYVYVHVVTFQQHLHMEYIYISLLIWYFGACRSYHDFLDWVAANKEASYWTKDFYWLCWSHHFEILRSLPRLGYPLFNICVTNDHGYVPFIVIILLSPHSRFITEAVTRLTPPLPLVERALVTTHDLSPRL
jgi:hypothetical protein